GLHDVTIQTQHDGARVSFRGTDFPVYGNAVTFLHRGVTVLERVYGDPVAYIETSKGRTYARIGYDLFLEVQRLLTKGQPPANAGIPTLDLHIEFLRRLITACGVPLIEIPPLPDAYPFIA